MDKLPLDGRVDLINKVVDDFFNLSKKESIIPNKFIYKIASKPYFSDAECLARKAALRNIFDNLTLVKQAFDTRRINQRFERNPRINLQYYNRSQQFIDAEKHNSMITFGKLLPPLEEISNEYGDQPEYFQSYSMDLHDLVNRVLRVKEADLEVFSPQLDYLKQLLYARYRLSMEDINNMSQKQLKDSILSKDETLLKRGNYLKNTNYKDNKKESNFVVKDGNKSAQDSIINAIFGNSNFRRDGEKKVERTITITIKDEVMD